MSCPACGAPLVSGQDRCGGCGTLLGPPVEGSLAPNPAPLRDLPGARRREREKTWKDEVRERVRHRKQEKSRDRELPLFKDEAAAAERPDEPEQEPHADPAPVRIPEMTLGEPLEASRDVGLAEPRPDAGPDLEDLPLHVAPGVPLHAAEIGRELEPEPARPAPRLDTSREEWPLGAPGVSPEAPVERPAFVAERARAAAVDLSFLATLWAVVVYFAYFAGRGAHVGAAQLVRTWPWLVGYMAFLGLVYAAYFTGTTGQTLGKILGNLRVVDTAGRPPGYLRSFVRAGLGALGILLAGLGLVPMLLDPARRGFHDKLLGTRVVRQ